MPDSLPFADIAARVLTERQYEIWTRRHRDGWEIFRIAQFLRVSKSTVEKDLAAAQRIVGEHLHARQEGEVRFAVTIALSAHEAATKEDTTAAEVARRLERMERRRGRLKVA